MSEAVVGSSREDLLLLLHFGACGPAFTGASRDHETEGDGSQLSRGWLRSWHLHVVAK